MIEYTSVSFCGIGGSGMSAIAQVLTTNQIKVCGTDRNFDLGNCLDMQKKLEAQNIKIYKQDGTYIQNKPDVLVVSTAVETTIPDVKTAMENNIPVIKRAELLAKMFNGKKGIAVGGTSGKSTVTGITGFLLYEASKDPTIINGGIMENFRSENTIGNAHSGKSEYMVIEADESDGTIELYNPFAAILTNISLDHKPLLQLRPLFLDFCNRTTGPLIINLDCLETMNLMKNIKNKNLKTFSLISENADYFTEEVLLKPNGSEFVLEGVKFRMQLPGKHNIANALAAIALCNSLGVSLEILAKGLAKFKGIGRRLQKIGTFNSITVFDDFGHNPEKIEATIVTLQEHLNDDQRLLIMYQPHGFAPTRMLKDGYIKTFSKHLRACDVLLLPEIFYAGGTVTRDISSNDLVEAIKAKNKQAIYFQNRIEIKDWILKNCREGDTIVIMGARDDTLTDYAKEILAGIQNTK